MINIYDELADSSRRKILLSLRTGAKCVNELVEVTGLKQPNVSNHLGRLRTKGLVSHMRNGRQVVYQLSSPDIERIVSSLLERSEQKLPELNLAEIATTYAEAAVAGDENTCAAALEEVYRAQTPLLDVYEGVLAPAMSLVGEWYKTGAIDEGQEHMASEITRTMMARTLHILGIRSRQGRTAVLGCGSNNYHVIGLAMIGDYLKFQGWNVIFLGADTPETAFLNAVRYHRPELVLVSCSAEEGRENTLSLIRNLDKLRGSRYQFEIGAGGGIVHADPQAFLRAGADFSAKCLRDFSEDQLARFDKSAKVQVSV